MSYSFTEKKRIRKSFGSRQSVLDVPYLLATQINSYEAFLQKDLPLPQRKDEGLEAAFRAIFPIVSHNQYVRMEYNGYTLARPVFDVRECQQRGLTYASALRAKVRLIVMDREAAKPTVKEVKEPTVQPAKNPSGAAALAQSSVPWTPSSEMDAAGITVTRYA